MKNIKGITLISLVITIVVLLILSSIATYSGMEIIKSSKFTAFSTELKIMQTQVNNIYQKYKDNENIMVDGVTYYGETEKDNEEKKNILEIGEEITGDIKTQADNVFAELQANSSTGITTQDGYLYWDKDLIKKLGIEGVEGDFFVNVEKRSVVSYEGFEYDGKMYYVVTQLADGLYNVDYQNANTGKPTFDASYQKLGENKWRITISNIQYDKYIDKWQVQYQLEGKEYWNTTEDLSFVVSEKGVYKIKIENGNIISDEKSICVEVPELEPALSEKSELSPMLYGVIEVEFLDGTSYKTTTIPNPPILKDGMEAVYWVDADGNINTEDPQSNTNEITSVSESYNKANWYKYVAQTSDSDGKTSRWANATTSDGSYYVWIPRYAYRIIYFDTQDNENAYRAGTLTEEAALEAGNIVGYSDARGIVDKDGKRPTEVTSTTAISVNEKYFRTHPAFDGNPDEGGWDNKLEGIWGMKYEASKGTDEKTPKSLPNVNSWREINVSTIFTYARDAYNDGETLNTILNSHMMKNSEWGAVAYFAESKYGRNGTEVSVNQCLNYITGAGRGIGLETDNPIYNSTYSVNTSTNLPELEQQYSGIIGQLSSTTGNIYGIYDMSGGCWEYVMGFYGTAENSPALGSTGLSSISERKYYNLYINKANTDGKDLGDALYETQVWNSDYEYFVDLTHPIFMRGGRNDFTSESGIFSWSRDSGTSLFVVGFRVCLAVQ